jgi:hypothetical protein
VLPEAAQRRPIRQDRVVGHVPEATVLKELCDESWQVSF